MTSVTISVPSRSIIDLFPQLPPGGSITRIYVDGDQVKVVYDHNSIRHPRDYPLDYEEWLRLPEPAPQPKPSPKLEPQTVPMRPRRKR